VSEAFARETPPKGADPAPPRASPADRCVPAADRARLWARIQDRIHSRLGHQRYGIWFGKTVLAKIEGTELVIGAPNVITQQYLDHQYRETVQEAAEQLLGRRVEVRFVVEPRLFRRMRAERRESVPPEREAPGEGREPDSGAPTGWGLPEGWHSFQRLVETDSNRLAFTAARAAALGRDPHFAFLLIVGRSGSGKTALLQAVHRRALESGAARRPECVTAEGWCNSYYRAVQAGRTWEFRRRYRGCDMLIMDDVCFLQGKRAAQDELRYTTQALLADARRVVLSSTVHPDDLQDVKPEFKTLLSGAFWAELVVPPPGQCEQVAKAMAGAFGVEPTGEVLRHLAQRHASSLQELSGAICSLAAYASMRGRTRIDLGLAREALAATSRARRREPTLEDIRSVIVQHFPVTEAQLSGKGRTRTVSEARHIAMYLARELTSASLSEIGRFFGGRTHSTVQHAIDKVRQKMDCSEHTAAWVQRCRAKLD